MSKASRLPVINALRGMALKLSLPLAAILASAFTLYVALVQEPGLLSVLLLSAVESISIWRLYRWIEHVTHGAKDISLLALPSAAWRQGLLWVRECKVAPAAPQKEARYPNFDLLRLLLALEVMLWHFAAWHHSHALRFWIINPVPSFVAVSGFLVLRSYERSGTWRKFAWKRICRVMPAMVASLILVGVIYGWNTIPDTIGIYITSGLKNYPHEHNGVLWSLSVEEWLYTVLAILFALKAYSAKWPIWAWVIMATFILPLTIWDTPRTIERIGWVFACFPVGSLIYIYRDRVSRTPDWIWPIGIVICGICSQFVTRYEIQLLSVATAVFVVGTGAFGPTWLPRPRWDLSYGIYVYHMPIFFWLTPLGVPAWLIAIACAGIATASWHTLESPALRAKNLFWPAKAEIVEAQLIVYPINKKPVI